MRDEGSESYWWRDGWYEGVMVRVGDEGRGTSTRRYGDMREGRSTR